MVYLARLPSGEVEIRTERPEDTPLFVGPYTLAEIFHRLAPPDNPMNAPLLHKRDGENASSHGLKPCHFHAKYDPASKSVILFDFAGYVGTVRTQADLWKAVVYQAEHGPGSLRALSRVPQNPPGDRYISPEEQARINREVAEFVAKAEKQRKAAAAKPDKSKLSGLTLEDLGL